jgi:hypothetical protein
LSVLSEEVVEVIARCPLLFDQRLVVGAPHVEHSLPSGDRDDEIVASHDFGRIRHVE